MKKTIILPTDFSDNARNAYKYAISMFGLRDVRYKLINTYDLPYSRVGMLINIKDILAKNSIEGLENELTYLKLTYPGIEDYISFTSIYGEFSDVLNEVVQEEKPDFIVLGTKGASGLEKVFVGSNAAKVIRKVNCPTIAVPSDGEFKLPKRIGFATDYDKLQEYSIRPLYEIAKKYDSKLLIFNITDEEFRDDFKSTTMESYSHPALQGIPQSFTSIQDDDIIEGIEDFIEDQDIDILAMVARHHNFFERIFHKSITKEMAMSMEEVPLLVMHEED